jgi:hypothetical protein
MQQQIRGWRIAAERTPSRRTAREAPLAPTALMMTSALRTACRRIGRGAMSAGAASRGGIAAVQGTNMKRVAGGLGLLAAGLGAGRWIVSRAHTMREPAPKNRWIMVTINCSPQRLASRADMPEPITRLGDAVDLKISPAPGDRGTELGARLRELPRTKIVGMVARRPEEDPRRMVEEALRQAKSLIETGEVLRPDWPPSARAAQGAKLLEFADRRGGRL